jgi:polyhydroxyalkanoate synthesis regulator phasin
MALNFPKLPGFGSADGKSRVFLIFAAIVAVFIVGYVLVKSFSGGATATGPSRVANPAASLQSVPGSKLTPEYYQALRQANIQATQQGQASGGSAVPTLINVPGQSFGAGNCTVLCPNDDNVNVANDINDLVKQGKLSQEDADKLSNLAKNNGSVDEYAAALDELVRTGKLTPEQARKLLDSYKKQHANGLNNESAQVMDGMIKSGQLSLDAANDLLAFQKTHPTPAQYAAELDRLVREGKLSPAAAAALLAQYSQQQQKERQKLGAYQLSQLAKAGEITSAVANMLADLQAKNVSVDDYAAQLQKLVKEGKLTPEAAAKLLEAYRKQRAGFIATGGIDAMVSQKEAACNAEVANLVKSGKITQETGDALVALQQKKPSLEDFQRALADLTKQGKISSADAQNKLACYKMVLATRDQANRLRNLQLNNASVSAYADELKRAVAAGLISPEMAAKMLQEYQASIAPFSPGSAPGAVTTLPGAGDFAKLQQQIAQQQIVPVQGPATTGQFSAAEAAAQAQALQDQQAKIQELQAAMSAQAQQLVAAWQPPTMVHKGGSPDDKQKGAPGAAAGSTPTSNAPLGAAAPGATGFPLIKTGTILFAVLDTGVNSDYPDTPVMATIVSGDYKGAKLMGKVQLGQGPTKDKVSLKFNMMDMSNWPLTKTINAFAIDPDTARTVMASAVDHHYLERYGAVMATSFISGYASAITQAGSTTTTGIFGTSSVHPNLSPASKLAVGIGQIGTNLNAAVQQYTNIPLTVTVNAGVGLGILFMADVTQ